MFHLAGFINVEVAVTPKRLTLGRQKLKKESATEKFSLKVTDPEKTKIKAVSVKDERFAIKMLSGDPKGDGEYELIFNGANELGRINTEVAIEIDGSEKPVKVPVLLTIVGDLRYSKSIFFVKKDDKFEPRDITFNTRSGKNVKIKGATDPTQTLKLKINSGKNTVTATLIDQKADYRKPKRGKFLVKTTDLDEPEIEISYMISERRSPVSLRRKAESAPVGGGGLTLIKPQKKKGKEK